MAITYAVSESRVEDMGFQSQTQGTSLSITHTKDYFVDVTVTGGDSQEDVSAYDVLTCTSTTSVDLPIVNRSIYTTPGGLIIPYVVCRDKRARRHPETLSRWVVSTDWGSFNNSNDETDNDPISPPAAITDITPQVFRSTEEGEYVRYVDQDGRAILTPNKQFYSEAAAERVSLLKLVILQYEASLTDNQLLQRRFKLNENSYRSKPEESWIIENLEVQDVTVTLSGPTPTDAVLCTYTLLHNPSPYGWNWDVALIDTVYNDGSGNVLPFQDGELKTIPYGFVRSDGTQYNSTPPLPDVFRLQPTIDFADFLRV